MDRQAYQVILKYLKSYKNHLNLFISRVESVEEVMAPVIWSRVPETTLSLRELYRAFIRENVVPVGQVKVDPA